MKRPLSRLHSMARDGMSKDGRKVSPMHVTLRAGVMIVNILFCSISAKARFLIRKVALKRVWH